MNMTISVRFDFGSDASKVESLIIEETADGVTITINTRLVSVRREGNKLAI